MRCTECGGELVIDRGEYTCRDCGLVHMPEQRLDFSDHHYPAKPRVRLYLPAGERERRIHHLFLRARHSGIKMGSEKLRDIIEFLILLRQGAFPRKPRGASWREIKKVEEALKDELPPKRWTPESYLAWCMQNLDIPEYFKEACEVMNHVLNRGMRTRVSVAIAYINLKYKLGLSLERIAHVCNVAKSTILGNLKHLRLAKG